MSYFEPPNLSNVSCRVTKGVMAFAYGVIFIAFIPLFIIFVRLLKTHFIEMYDRMKIKLYVTFVGFNLVLAFRYGVYILIQFTEVAWLNVESVRGEIPLYVSEIFISLCYMYIMVNLYQ